MAAISAARNEWEAFQVVVDDVPSPGLAVTKPALILQGSTVQLPSDEVRLYREGLIAVATPSNIEGAVGQWPDPLIPIGGESVAALNITTADGGTSISDVVTMEARAPIPQAARVILWVDIHVPAGAAAGIYSGTMALAAGSWRQEIPVTLEVRPFTLPSSSQMPSSIGFAVDSVCRAHLPKSALDSGTWCTGSEMIEFTQLYAAFMLDHRLTIRLPYPATRSNWPASVAGYQSAYSALINGSAAAAGTSQLIGARPTSLWFPWWRDGQADNAAGLGAWYAMAKGLGPIPLEHAHMDNTGKDEPNTPADWLAIAKHLSIVRGVDPTIPTLVTGPPQGLKTAGVEGLADIMCVVLDDVDGKAGQRYPGNNRDAAQAFLARGPRGKVWGYQSCDQYGCGGSTDATFTGWPSLVVDATAMQNRAEPWMHYIYQLTGLHYWDTVRAYDAIPQAPDFAGANLLMTGGNGDGDLLYPGTPVTIGGTTHIPVASIRLKLFREGMEDWEYLRLCEQVSRVKARQIAMQLFPADEKGSGSMHGAAAASPEDLESARAALGRCIAGTWAARRAQ